VIALSFHILPYPGPLAALGNARDCQLRTVVPGIKHTHTVMSGQVGRLWADLSHPWMMDPDHQ
jgi:hypothetical protein